MCISILVVSYLSTHQRMDYHCMLEHLLVKRVDLEPAPCWSIPLQRNTELPRTVLFQWSKPWGPMGMCSVASVANRDG